MSDPRALSPVQQGLGDMDPREFRDAGHRVVDQVADYLENLESYPVLPDIQPGSVKGQLPASPPAGPEPMGDVLSDYERLIQPNITHWQHPGFMAYFPAVAAGPGILGEWLAAALNSNVMMWRNAPASTELEELVVSWLRQMMGLPDVFDGMLTDTASMSSLTALVAARHAAPGLDASEKGLTGRNLQRLRLYTSEQAHLSIEKAAMVVGVGREGVRRIPVDDAFRMRPDALEEAIAEDRDSGWQPFCVVGTLGTTSTTSVDPATDLARICKAEGLWLHLDAAYAGAAAMLEEHRHHFAGWEEADSIVFNPHKWMFAPIDASLLLFRHPEIFRGAFSLVPEYLQTRTPATAHNYSEYGIPLGRRFRALKLWMLIRYFGVDGITARLREHCRLASEFAAWVDAEQDWERLAPAPFSTVCFRHHPEGVATERLDALNEAILDEVNRGGQFFLSHTVLNGSYTLRVALGNPRTARRHVEECWSTLKRAAETARIGRAP